ncbi:cytochrome P450 [Saccharopolyspora sp. K220]|uniref:cytochrome P450 family protein n=1 Tax=Saccharopolyspora soli TaxID=2926618 RepID=UPI001F56582D|nr:cytochrome P450 [Saccharopolyspora soli]MCI2422223.1 cytochrome P450 [Saccharopolyspora soli]
MLADPVRFTPQFKAEAPERYAELRARGPIHRVTLSNGVDAWVVVSYEAARAALTHPALRKDPTSAADVLAAAGITSHLPGVGLGGQMLEADPPEHTRLRRLVASAFSPRRIQGLRGGIEEICDELLDAIAPLGETDLVETFTGPLPVAVISELLGIPEPLRAEFRVQTFAALSVPSDEQRAAAADLNALLSELLDRKREQPEDDLLSALIAVHDEDDGRLSRTELVGTAVLLVVAGHETTVNLLGNALLALFRAPGQADLLRSDPELIPGAIEEFLRYDPSVELTTPRYAAEDCELGGQRISRGDVVVVALGSASHDLAVTGDAGPPALDVTRSASRHLAFGHGVHHCLGAPLARLEAAVALSRVLTRFPDLRLAVPEHEIQWVPSGMMRGPLRLPVRFKAE